MTAERGPVLPPDFGSDTRFDDAVRRSLAEESACHGISTEALEAGAVADLVRAAKATVSAGSWELSYALHLSEPPISDLRAALAKLEVKP